jgi:hypothetical protein
MTHEEYDDLVIATALLLGAEIVYDDYGHPERALARLYWSIRNQPPDAYGSTCANCAWQWLGKKGLAVNRRTGAVEKI